MGYFLDLNNNYYEGDKIHPSHTEVTQRPSTEHSWNGSAWVEDSALLELKKIREILEAEQKYIRNLEELIEILISKGTITLADFDQNAQDRHTYRTSRRS